MPMPPGEERGEIGNMFLILFNFFLFYIYHFYVCIEY
jgi:hypothetical protein